MKRILMRDELSLLKKIEWVGRTFVDAPCCPACGMEKSEGSHTKKCRLNRMIRERKFMLKVIKEQLRK